MNLNDYGTYIEWRIVECRSQIIPIKDRKYHKLLINNDAIIKTIGSVKIYFDAIHNNTIFARLSYDSFTKALHISCSDLILNIKINGDELTGRAVAQALLNFKSEHKTAAGIVRNLFAYQKNRVLD